MKIPEIVTAGILLCGLMACGTAAKTGDVPTSEGAVQEVAAPAGNPTAETTDGASHSTETPATDAAGTPANDPVEAPDSNAAGHDAGADEDVADHVRCEAKIEFEGELFSSEALGPTIEEARDNAIDDTCAIPCSEKLPDAALDAEREVLLEQCIEQCAAESVAVAAQCWQHGVSIHTEGAWSPTNDQAPTNGAEH